MELYFVKYITEYENYINKKKLLHYTDVKPVNKGPAREKQILVFIDKWSLFGGFCVLFNQ